ncbi:phosphoglycerate kinase [Thermoplasmatales archaeon AK]|nr:phosphoglycerate kinase [Thermoplasmatales archaeon AK]
MDDFDLSGKTVYLRLDINSPINPITGEITDHTRFLSHLETIRDLRSSKVVLVAHQSRPGKSDFTSLRKHAILLERLTGRSVEFIDSLFGSQVDRSVSRMDDGDILMLENSRFYSEEVDIDPSDIDVMESTNLVKSLSKLFDYYIIDAFPAIHRAQTTLVGFRRIKPNIAGRLIEREIKMLEQFTGAEERPKIAILGGAKIEDSVRVSMNFLDKGIVDRILAGGVVANAFLWASGMEIGKRNRDFIIKNNKNYEEIIDSCRKILNKHGRKIMLPTDFVLNPSGRVIEARQPIPEDQILADIGFQTISAFTSEIDKAKAIFLNGPMGIYEIEEYSVGTREVLEAVSRSQGLTIAGGGHTLGALEMLGLTSKITHASTGGGALISYLSGEPMPVLQSLIESKRIFGGKNGRQ